MTKKHLWFALPVLLFLYQTMILAHYGFGSNDYGYLFGMGWRILNGEEMYIDFLYARPPLSPYLTAFWLYVLPEDGQFYYARVINYLYGFITSYLMLLLFKRHFTDYFKGAQVGLILALLIIFNVNYIVHFWHTVDGLLMTSIALSIMLTKETPSYTRIFFGSVFIVLAMMAKQSFYPLAFALAPLLLINYNLKTALNFVATIIVLLSTVVGVAYVFANEQLLAYLDFKQYQSQLAPFLEAAVLYYVMGWLKLFPIVAIVVFLANWNNLYKYMKRKQWAKVYARFMLYFARGFIILYALLLLQFTQTKLVDGISIIIFHTPLLGGLLVAVLWLLIEFQQKRLSSKQIKSFMILLMTLAAAWMSSLSWGYKTPALYSGSIIFFFIYLNWHYTRKHIPSMYLVGLFFSYVLAITALQFNSVDAKSVHLGDYSKKLSGIYQRNIHEHKTFMYVDDEVKKCKEKGQAYTVLPSNPYIHWIHDDRPTLSLDWVSNVEMLNKQERLKKEIDEVDCVILDPYYEFWENEKYGIDSNRLLGIDYNATKHQELLDGNLSEPLRPKGRSFLETPN